MKKIVIFLMCLVFIPMGLFAAVKVGDIAPDFNLNSITGEKVLLNDFKGKVVFLNFFATWCGPCRAETPDLVKVYSLYKDNKNVKFVSIVLQDTKEKTERFVDEYKMTWPVLLDEKGTVARLYNIRGIPTNLILDKEGRITFLGHVLSDETLRKELEKALK